VATLATLATLATACGAQSGTSTWRGRCGVSLVVVWKRRGTQLAVVLKSVGVRFWYDFWGVDLLCVLLRCRQLGAV